MGNRNDSGSRGNLSGASLAGGADSGFRGAAKTKARLRKIRKMQLDKMKKFREAVGDARADQLLNAQKAMVSKFNNPTGKSVASLGSSGIGGILNGSGSGKKATSKSNRNDLVGSSGNGGSSGFSIPKPNYDLSYNTGGDSGSGSGMSREMSEAQDRLAEAVEYRDENPSDFDKNKDGDTLWKIITRSYIRNYDKLLRKRKKRIDPGL
jgi:hypothetical protein